MDCSKDTAWGNDGALAVAVPNHMVHGLQQGHCMVVAYWWYAMHRALSNSVVGQHDDEDVVVTPVVAKN